MATIQWPYGAADLQAPAYAAAMSLEITNRKTVVTPAQLTGALTLNVAASTNHDLKAGDTLTLKFTADGTNRVVTFGTGITGTALTVLANKTFMVQAEYTGAGFDVLSANQID